MCHVTQHPDLVRVNALPIEGFGVSSAERLPHGHSLAMCMTTRGNDEDMDKLEATFTVEKDTKRTRRFTEDTDGAPAIGTLYVQQWALKKLTGGTLPERIRVKVELVD